MNEHFDTLETRDPQERERALLAAVRRQVAYAKSNAPGFAKILHDVDAEALRSRDALAAVPVTRKSDLVELQRGARPFGGLAATTRGSAAQVFASPGPIYEPAGRGADCWRLARSLFAAGFRAGDLVHNCYAYHLTPAGAMLESGALALGCTVFAGGTGQTELQVQAMADLSPDGYVGTPSFLKIILDKADEQHVALPSLNKAQVSGEPFSPSLRDALGARGIAAYQVYASADLGAIAYESPAREGLIVDEGVLLEILRPGTGDAVADGEVGEVVVTTLFNTDYPLIRFGTGDLSAILPGASHPALDPRVGAPARRRADQGLDGTRRPGHQGQGHVRAPVAGGGRRAPACGNHQGAARRRQSRRCRPHDVAVRGACRRRGHRARRRRQPARRHQAARRS